MFPGDNIFDVLKKMHSPQPEYSPPVQVSGLLGDTPTESSSAFSTLNVIVTVAVIAVIGFTIYRLTQYRPPQFKKDKSRR